MNQSIAKPSKKEVQHYLKQWEAKNNEKYVYQESALDKLFLKTYPNNTEMDDILIKCSALNDFYSTNIYSTFRMAKHIKELNIDDRLKNNNPHLVKDIATLPIRGKNKFFYSFATKYCSHHNSEYFPIYDTYVEKCLSYFKKQDGFAKFKLADLKDYSKFKEILEEFKEFYHLKEYSLKEIDKYLWQLGKEKFPKKYKKLS